MARYENAIVREINIPAKRRRERVREQQNTRRAKKRTALLQRCSMNDLFCWISVLIPSRTEDPMWRPDLGLTCRLLLLPQETDFTVYSQSQAQEKSINQPTNQRMSSRADELRRYRPALNWVEWEDEHVAKMKNCIINSLDWSAKSLSSARCAMCNEIMNQIGHS